MNKHQTEDTPSLTDRGLQRRFLFALGGVVAIILLLSLTKIFEDDVFWHLATGRWIWQNSTIPSTDVFGFVTQGNPWIPFEWGWDVLAYLLFTLSQSYFFLQFSTGVLWAGVCVLLFITMKKNGVPLSIIVFIVLITVFVSVGRMTPRPQVITSLGLSIVSALIYTYRSSSVKQYKLLYIFPVIFFLWGNMHPGVLAGLALLGLFVAAEIIAYYLPGNRKSSISKEQASASRRNIILVAALSIIAALLNVHGFETFRYTFSHTRMEFLSAIEEWTPPFQTDSFFTIVTFYTISLVLGSVSILYSFKRKDPFPALAYIVFALYSLRAIRFIGDFAIVTAIGTAISWQYLLSLGKKELPNVLQSKALQLSMIGLIVIIILSIPGGLLYRTLGIDLRFGIGIDDQRFSAGLMDFLKNNDIKGKPFHQFDLGGQLIWERPGEQNFIDSRNLNDKIANIYGGIMSMQPGFERAMEHYGIDYCLLHIRDLRLSADNMKYSLVPYCSTHRDVWKLVYWDDQSFLYLKNIPKFRHIINRFGYTILDPYLFSFKPKEFDSLLIADPAMSQRELSRKLTEEPEGFIANFIANQSSGKVR